MFYFLFLVVGFPILLAMLTGMPRGSVYLHILGITIPLVIRTGTKKESKFYAMIWEPVTSLNNTCCDRYKRTKSYHSPACRKR